MNKRISRHNLIVFSDEWFEHYNPYFCGILNSKVIGNYFRELLDIQDKRIIVKLVSNGYHVTNLDNTYQFFCYAQLHIVEKFIENFDFIFRLMHIWDMKIANKISKKINFGFDTLSAYYDSGVSNGQFTFYNTNTTTGTPFATIRTATSSPGGNGEPANQGSRYIGMWSATVSGNYWYACHGFWAFITSSIGSTATISSATFRMTISDTVNGLDNVSGLSYCLYTNAGVTSWSSCGWNETWTAWSDTLNNSAIYNTGGNKTFTLNSTGLAAINKTGNTYIKLGINNFITSTAPTWASGTSGRFYIYITTGTTADKILLTVNYTLPSTTQKSMYL